MKGNTIEQATPKPTRPTTKRPTTTTLAPTTSATQLPVFDTNVITNVSAPLGGTAYLHCKVRYLTARTVSWVRRRDWHILSSGLMTYTNDDRFTVLHADNSEDWHLQIKFVQKRDNGTYECQVSTGVGTISHYYHLHVVTPYAYIEGNGEYHIGEGSTISLVCIVENSPSPPQYVFWYHNDRMINYDTERGGVEVGTEVRGENTQSTLTVNHATSADSGNYTCRAPNTAQDTIYVFVSKGNVLTLTLKQLPGNTILCNALVKRALEQNKDCTCT
ncbi:hypothetical protein J6590_060034 [Homalodisca vitripennis]|nr:hypothetical protein J6590_060034 [Homalodisca vitripennis]